jgi:hypothetical protein
MIHSRKNISNDNLYKEDKEKTNISMLNSNSLGKHWVYLPIAVLICLIIWLQMLPGTNNGQITETSNSNILSNKALTHDEIKSFISAEIRDSLVETSRTSKVNEEGYPPIKNLAEGDKLRILVTGGSGFVGSHLVDRLMMQGINCF